MAIDSRGRRGAGRLGSYHGPPDRNGWRSAAARHAPKLCDRDSSSPLLCGTLYWEAEKPPVQWCKADFDRGRPRVLAGQDDHIAMNGVDRWVGGVHLQGHRVPWRWDELHQKIVRSR